MKKKLPSVADIFSKPIIGDGYIGDEAIVPDLEALIGQQVTGWRLGWDDSDEAENDPDHTPYSEMGYASHELTGILTSFKFTLPDGVTDVGWEVGGQPADPASIRPAKTPKGKAKAGGTPPARSTPRPAKTPKKTAKGGGQPADAKTVRPAKPPVKKAQSGGKTAAAKAVPPAKPPRKKAK